MVHLDLTMTQPGAKIIFLLAAAVIFNFITHAQSVSDLVGLTLLRATATNVNGSGIRVGQPEANLGGEPSQFEVNPPNVNQPVSRFTYASADGTSTTYPNAVGIDSWHADTVGRYYYGMPDGLATNVAQVDNFDADFYVTNYVQNLQPAENDSVVNQSFEFFPPLDAADQEQEDSMYDDYEETYDTLFVSAVGNPSGTNNYSTAPGTAYNSIGVGAYYDMVNYGNIGPTIDNGRCKPDITALTNVTSFSTPQVAGAAADLMQAALRGDGGSDTNSAFNVRTIKALLLNGAVKPLGWTHSSSSPLDFRYGAGVVNVFNSYQQLVGGKHDSIASELVTSGGAHPPTGDAGTVSVLNGWDYATSTSSSFLPQDAINHYYFNVSNSLAGAAFTATATLVWNRQKGQADINHLSLFLYNCANSNLVACSTSLVDNVEHIYLTGLAQGRYDLQVWKAGGLNIVSAAEPYALAFEFFSDTLEVIQSGTNTALTWPLYPAGFVVEATTNLISPNWTTNNLPPATITNSRNSLLLSPTNAYQFFRLREPDL